MHTNLHYIHTYIHTYIQTYIDIQTDIQIERQMYKQTKKQANTVMYRGCVFSKSVTMKKLPKVKVERATIHLL